MAQYISYYYYEQIKGKKIFIGFCWNFPASSGLAAEAKGCLAQKRYWPGGGGTRPMGERRKWYMNFD